MLLGDTLGVVGDASQLTIVASWLEGSALAAAFADLATAKREFDAAKREVTAAKGRIAKIMRA